MVLGVLGAVDAEGVGAEGVGAEAAGAGVCFVSPGNAKDGVEGKTEPAGLTPDVVGVPDWLAC